MDHEIVKSSIVVERFSLDFCVNLAESVDWTKSFESPTDKDFVFASGEIWATSPEIRSLIIEEIPGENLLTTLSALRHSMRSFKPLPEIESQIPLGGWCKWMRGYWGRLDSDSSAPDDELICSSLMPALLFEGKKGWIAAYRYGGEQILEVGERAAELSYWSVVNSDDLCVSIDAAALQLSSAIRTRLRPAEG